MLASDVPSSQVTTALLVLVAVQFLSGSFRIWQQSWRTERHQLKEAAHWTVQPMPLPEATWASTWQTYNFQFSVLLPSTGNRSLLPTASVLLSHWWHRTLVLLQHHRLSLKDFSVCGLLTKGTRNRMEKSLYMTAWLKVNFDELSDTFMIVYNYDADLEVSDTCVRSSLLSWVCCRM